MDIKMPAAFPGPDFQAFGIAASAIFPPILSDETLFDSQEKRRHFDWSWQAVRYRYRNCFNCNEDFKRLLARASELWQAGWSDEELIYEVERCIYQFFTSGLSIFDSFAFCLYFYGNALKPSGFPEVARPRDIRRDKTAQAFKNAFPEAALTGLLTGLPKDARFRQIDFVRNIVGHRVSGRRSVQVSSTTAADGTHTHWRKETWHLPGLTEALIFDEELLQRQLDGITGLLASLSSAAREFAESQRSAREA